MATQPLKVAILGGGMGALSAAFHLTERAEDRKRYEITVYQVGWRLGGKGASGRNADVVFRSEEHGLHVWLGWYHNSFWIMRHCYQDLGASINDAFSRHHHFTIGDRRDDGWAFWCTQFPGDDG